MSCTISTSYDAYIALKKINRVHQYIIVLYKNYFFQKIVYFVSIHVSDDMKNKYYNL